MKKLTIILILTSQLAKAQSSFYGGVHGSANMTTLLNQEDKAAPKGVLDKKKYPTSGIWHTIRLSL